VPLDPAGLDWTPEGAPRSQRFGDIYFSRQGGLEETRAVFLQGCGLPGAWQGRPHFTIGELGFGSGLNILALLDLWSGARTAGQRLWIFSIEAYPLSREDARRALGAWPEIQDLARPLLDAWPRLAPGFHRLDWPHLGATLDLAIGEAAWALRQWDGRADAWFLDGFSPALNPEMWREAVLAGVAARSAPGAAVATFTVAGAVRRGLQAAGFAVDKRPGHGAKRERLEARWPGPPAMIERRPSVAIVGAGIAGAALVRALTAAGLEPVMVEARGAGAGASGNPAALVTPALDAGGGPRARLYAQAFARAADLYGALNAAVAARGVLQLEKAARDAARFDAVMASDVFAPGALERLGPEAASAALRAHSAVGALRFAEGLTIRPPVVLEAWLAGARRITARVTAVEPRAEGGWILRDDQGEAVVAADAVCIAAGAGTDALLPAALPLGLVRGQASWVRGLRLPMAAAWGGYAAAFDDAVLFGATHDRGRTDVAVDAADHRRNLAALAQVLPALAEAAAARPLEGRAGVRAAAADRLPVAGALAPGLFVLGGLGSRGFTTAPLLAEHVAARVAGVPSPLPLDLQPLVELARLSGKPG
jgi:tRNA 5-methylaminomethyl-2-thiouridine biosynthesis bifunctional protein